VCKPLIVAIGLFALVVCDTSPVLAGWACIVTPTPEPPMVWGETEAAAQEAGLRLCQSSPKVQSSNKQCSIFHCFSNIDNQQQATDVWWRMVIKTFVTPPK
jgi:hypothetical protein